MLLQAVIHDRHTNLRSACDNKLGHGFEGGLNFILGDVMVGAVNHDVSHIIGHVIHSPSLSAVGSGGQPFAGRTLVRCQAHAAG